MVKSSTYKRNSKQLRIHCTKLFWACFQFVFGKTVRYLPKKIHNQLIPQINRQTNQYAACCVRHQQERIIRRRRITKIYQQNTADIFKVEHFCRHLIKNGVNNAITFQKYLQNNKDCVQNLNSSLVSLYFTEESLQKLIIRYASVI